jgi:hypothetical protein
VPARDGVSHEVRSNEAGAAEDEQIELRGRCCLRSEHISPNEQRSADSGGCLDEFADGWASGSPRKS